MAILRKQQRSQYTVIDNTIFRDTSLSNKALGMLCRMLSLPDGWEFSILGLTKLSNDGKSAVMSQLDELEQHGYLVRKQVRVDGKIAGVEYIVSEVQISDFPYADFQHTEKQHAENSTQSNTNTSITNLSKNEDIYTEFEKLWNLYPRKQGKDKAFGYYKKARKSGTTYEEVEVGIQAYITYIRVNEIEAQYVKMGSTFFSQKAWSDDWTIKNRAKSGRSRQELFARLYEEHKDDL